jgi:hypothetical protein
MRIAYFVHDLGDAAVARRVRMLKAAGADLAVLGFRRGAQPIFEVEDVAAVDLGRTFDARLGHRFLSVARRLAFRGSWCSSAAGADVFLARNLEMLLLAAAVRDDGQESARLCYECLDIHRSMISRGPAGVALRALERRLLRRSGALIVSSPEFISNYFGPVQGVGDLNGLSVHMLENKVFPGGAEAVPRTPRAPGPVWRIGWFGAIRCSRSLDMLSALAARRPDLVEVVIRGKPSLTEFPDFHGQVSRGSALSFRGPYDSRDLQSIYREVHFNWAVDYFDAGGNSQWLLPNRLYEGGRSAAVPIALAPAATGTWLSANKLGVLMSDPATELEPFLEGLTPAAYRDLERACLGVPASAFVADRTDCGRLTRALTGVLA